MNTVPITRPCPSCQLATVVVEQDWIRCQSEDCKFAHQFTCPICEGSLINAKTSEDSYDQYLHCGGCSNLIGLKKIKYLVDNGMQVDDQNRCTLCNGPTVHKATMNLGHRCFFFPKCSGQTDLFGATRESFIFLDFETTGLEAGRDYIIEVGAVKIDEEGYEHAFQELIKPPTSISPKITQITGITNAMVENASNLKPVLERLVAFMGNAKLVIHNADFDMIWLLTALIRHQLTLPTSTVTCTLRWARAMAEPGASLGALTKKYGIRHGNAHRALADASATKEIFFVFDRAAKVARPNIEVNEFRRQAEKIVERYAGFVQA